MSTIRAVENRIARVEGFRVRILHLAGADVRGDKQGIPQYPYERAMKNIAHVSAWRERRFHQRYPGFDVEVQHADGRRAHGGTLLGTVRDGYLDD